jgi:hypothetical protein
MTFSLSAFQPFSQMTFSLSAKNRKTFSQMAFSLSAFQPNRKTFSKMTFSQNDFQPKIGDVARQPCWR